MLLYSHRANIVVCDDNLSKSVQGASLPYDGSCKREINCVG